MYSVTSTLGLKKLTLPWSKSITNRDLILASLTEWKTRLDWILISDDTRFMINALKDLGVKIEDYLYFK